MKLLCESARSALNTHRGIINCGASERGPAAVLCINAHGRGRHQAILCDCELVAEISGTPKCTQGTSEGRLRLSCTSVPVHTLGRTVHDCMMCLTEVGALVCQRQTCTGCRVNPSELHRRLLGVCFKPSWQAGQTGSSICRAASSSACLFVCLFVIICMQIACMLCMCDRSHHAAR